MEERVKKQVVKIALDFYDAWKNHDIEDREVFNQIFWDAIEQILDIDEVKHLLAWGDVSDALINAPLYTEKSLDDLSDVDLAEYIGERLLTERDYTGIFPLYDSYSFPAGLRLGWGEITTFNGLPQDVRNHLLSVWRSDFRKQPGHFRKQSEYIDDKKQCAIVRVQVIANGPQRALEKSTDLVDDSLHILRRIRGRDIGISHRVVYALPQIVAHIPGEGGGGSYNATFKPYIESLTEVLIKDNPSDLEKRLRVGARLYGLSRTTKRPEIGFTLLMAGLESMLLGPEDRDFLGHRLAEKVAFLLEQDKEGRTEMYRRVKDLYGTRSGFVHEGKSISKQDEADIHEIHSRVFERLLELKSQGYVSVAIKDGLPTIDLLVRDLRFQ